MAQLSPTFEPPDSSSDLRRLGRRILDLLLPIHCLACGAPVEPSATASERAAGIGLCRACTAKLRRIDPHTVCRTCARPLGGCASEEVDTVGPPTSSAPALQAGLCGVCGICGVDLPPQASLFALWQYQPPLREVIHAFKFRRLDYLGEALGRNLAHRLGERVDPQVFDAIVPVPLAWPRQIARGYNQCTEIGRAAARELRLPLRRWLRRDLFRLSQTGRRRKARLQTGGFRVAPFRSLRDRRILLLDDVYTTGATVRAASRVLLQAGAARVDVAVVGWTPPPGLATAPKTAVNV